MKNIKLIHIIALLVALFALANSFFILDERQSALVLKFGKIERKITEPGLKLKIPFVENIIYFDNRILGFTAVDKEVNTSNHRRFKVNAYMNYKIDDIEKFYKRVRNKRGVKNRLNTILDSSLREVLGEKSLSDLLSKGRSDIMSKIEEVVTSKTLDFGVDIVDVRIIRTDLPEENSNAIYERMKSERVKKAKKIRAEGEEESKKIIAEAKKENKIIIANAKKEASIIIGQGEAEANRIYAWAYGKDLQFFEFYRSMRAYEDSVNSENSKIVISTENDFFKYMTNYSNPKIYK